MPRIILLLLVVAALIILAVQNLATSISLVILGSAKTPEIPFGLLLVGAICLGALITLILYGLVGLQRPPESKYRPLGRRVPYPESPGSTSPSGTPYTPTASYSGPRSSSTAFVSEPKIPQDSAPSDRPQNSAQNSAQNSTQNRGTSSQTPFSTVASNYSDPLPSGQPPSPEPPFTVRKPPFPFMGGKTEKKKGKRQDPLEEPRENARIGDNWGEKRTAEHLNSWDIPSNGDRDSGAAGQNRGFFDFIGIGSSPPNTNRITDDIAAGWDENSEYAAPYDRYDDDRSGDYRTGTGYGTDHGYDEDLDSGWENFDDPSNHRTNAPLDNQGKRIYRDGLYDDGLDEGYRDESYRSREEGYEDEDDVYEADYRVIVPPSKSLDDREEDYPA